MFNFFKKKKKSDEEEESRKIEQNETANDQTPSHTGENAVNESGEILPETDDGSVEDMIAMLNKLAEQAGGADSAKSYLSSQLGKDRYYVEHVMFRRFFADRPKELTDILLGNNGGYGLYRSCYEQLAADFPYTPEDFVVKRLKAGSGCTALCICLPKPEFTPICYRVYFVFNEDFSKTEYYTIERSPISGGFLCRWDGDLHENIHGISQSGIDNFSDESLKIEFKAIVDLFMKGQTEFQTDQGIEKYTADGASAGQIAGNASGIDYPDPGPDDTVQVCHSCGKVLIAGVSICKYCGAKLR